MRRGGTEKKPSLLSQRKWKDHSFNRRGLYRCQARSYQKVYN